MVVFNRRSIHYTPVRAGGLPCWYGNGGAPEAGMTSVEAEAGGKQGIMIVAKKVKMMTKILFELYVEQESWTNAKHHRGTSFLGPSRIICSICAIGSGPPPGLPDIR